MRLASGGLIKDVFDAVHSFIGGRVSRLVVVLWAALGLVFVATYGQRLPQEAYPPPSLCAEGLSDLLQVWKPLVSVFVQPDPVHLVVSCFVIYLVMWFVARRMGVVVSVVTVVVSGAVANVAGAALTGNPVCGFLPAAMAALFLCAASFPYLRFFRYLSARTLAICAITGLAFLHAPRFSVMGILSGVAGIPFAVTVFLAEPHVRLLLRKWWLHRQVQNALLEAEEEERLDEVLKKVSRVGIEGLTRRERNFLFSMSRRYRKKVGEGKR